MTQGCSVMATPTETNGLHGLEKFDTSVTEETLSLECDYVVSSVVDSHF